jgi:phosphopantothenoylcysteine decarboxylase / phosphopantothenate---cysteine ligase
LLVKAGAEVRVVATGAALDFVSPLALSTVSKNPVLAEVANGSEWNNHVALGLWADAMLVAPCSANTLAKMANGICDNLLCAVFLSLRCPVWIAPAMDEDMWKHPATQANVQKVASYNCHIVPVGHGELASGLNGAGRMEEPEALVAILQQYFGNADKPLSGKKAVVTAGPTYERIDPVRFIGNFSTGKMGLAIAEALADAGADVTMISGPVALFPGRGDIAMVRVESAAQMYEAVSSRWQHSDIGVMAAAVADYRPAVVADNKIKKSGAELTLSLVKTEDILGSLGKIKSPAQTLVGFALETNNEVAHATDKLERKNADMIVLNSLKDAGAGFGHDTNKVTLIRKDTKPDFLPLMSKSEVAKEIVRKIVEIRNER